jgi:hypothetical protein
MSCYWDILPLDLQKLICKIALCEEKAFKIQNILRLNRPMLGCGYNWTRYVDPPGCVYGPWNCFMVGDKVLVQIQHFSGKIYRSIGFIDKIGGTKYLYDCRIFYPNGDGKLYYYYSSQKQNDWVPLMYPKHAATLKNLGIVNQVHLPGPYQFKSITVLIPY